MENYTLTDEQREWSSKRRHGVSTTRLRELITKQKGRCALSDAPLTFNKKEGTPKKAGDGCHPLYVAVDHIAPKSEVRGFQLVCYDLNDLKGHLSIELFTALSRTTEWCDLMQRWKALAEKTTSTRADFKALIFS